MTIVYPCDANNAVSRPRRQMHACAYFSSCLARSFSLGCDLVPGPNLILLDNHPAFFVSQSEQAGHHYLGRPAKLRQLYVTPKGANSKLTLNRLAVQLCQVSAACETGGRGCRASGVCLLLLRAHRGLRTLQNRCSSLARTEAGRPSVCRTRLQPRWCRGPLRSRTLLAGRHVATEVWLYDRGA